MFNSEGFLQKINADAFLVSNFFNIIYTTGFQTLSPTEREAYVLITKERLYIITDSRYERGDVADDIDISYIKDGKTATDSLQGLCQLLSVKSLGYEGDNLTWNEAQTLQKIGVHLAPFTRAFSFLRSIKKEEEIFAIKQACHIGDSVLRDMTPYIHPGQTEKELAWIIEKLIREAYASELAFDPIVAVDEHSAIPHYNTKMGSGSVKEASLLLLDFGVKRHNYCSDITRMVAIGDIPDEIITTYRTLLSAQVNTIKYIQSATQLKDVDLFCRSELKRDKLPNYSHSTGHGIGLEVHEFPKVSGLSHDDKQAGEVFTIEPGVYIPGKWGMRIEDTIFISPEGEVEVLTRFPKELILV